jgi:hypothetical protein
MNHCIATSACLPLTRSAAKAEAENTARLPESAKPRNRKSKRKRQNKGASQAKFLKNYVLPESASLKQASGPDKNLAENKNFAPIKNGTLEDTAQGSNALKGKLKNDYH